MNRPKEIDGDVLRLFSARWAHLHDSRGEKSLARADLKFPGVYLLAYSATPDIEGSIVKAKDVLYVGMSNAAGGVRQRLKQFRAGIEVNGLHSGAMRFYREYCGGKPFVDVKNRKKLYFAAQTFECESNKGLAEPDDLRLMGHINCLEYYAVAHIVEKTGKKPPLNKLGPRPKS
jgi:hypothetical protein